MSIIKKRFETHLGIDVVKIFVASSASYVLYTRCGEPYEPVAIYMYIYIRAMIFNVGIRDLIKSSINKIK